jgi:hypothetical protein
MPQYRGQIERRVRCEGLGMRQKLPEPPNKERLIELLNKTHFPCVPNWTTAEQEEAYLMLEALGYLWFRDEKVLTRT